MIKVYIPTSEFVSFLIQTYPIFQHGVRIEDLFALLFNKENIQIESSSFLHTVSLPDKKYNSANRINSSGRGEEKERFQCFFSIFEYIVFYSISSASTCNPAKNYILHIELILLQEISNKYFNYKAHPMQTDTRHPPATVHLTSKHSTWQKPSWSPYKDSQDSSNSTHRNSILSSRQHPHTLYKIPQAHFYRILQGEIGFFSKGLSIALSCSTKISVSKTSLSYCFLCIELLHKNFQEN